MATAVSEQDLLIKEASTGENLTDNLHPTAKKIEDEEEFKSAGLDALTPRGTRVIANGEEFYIKGWLLGDALDIAADIGTFGIQFSSIDRNDIPVVMSVIVHNLPTVLRVVGLSLKRDLEFAKQISFNELPEIIKAVYKENEPFFRAINEILPDNTTDRTTTEETQIESSEESEPATETPLTGSD